MVVASALLTRISLSDDRVVYGLEVTDVDGEIRFNKFLQKPPLIPRTYSTSPSSMYAVPLATLLMIAILWPGLTWKSCQIPANSGELGADVVAVGFDPIWQKASCVTKT